MSFAESAGMLSERELASLECDRITARLASLGPARVDVVRPLMRATLERVADMAWEHEGLGPASIRPRLPDVPSHALGDQLTVLVRDACADPSALRSEFAAGLVAGVMAAECSPNTAPNLTLNRAETRHFGTILSTLRALRKQLP